MLTIVRFVFGSSLLLVLVRDGGIPQGCPLSTVFIVALCVLWCRHLDSLPDVKPQLDADNLKCSAERPRALFESARFTAQYVQAVGQGVMVASGRSGWLCGMSWRHFDFTERARRYLVLQGQGSY